LRYISIITTPIYSQRQYFTIIKVKIQLVIHVDAINFTAIAVRDLSYCLANISTGICLKKHLNILKKCNGGHVADSERHLFDVNDY